jgi:hypothetical protein
MRNVPNSSPCWSNNYRLWTHSHHAHLLASFPFRPLTGKANPEMCNIEQTWFRLGNNVTQSKNPQDQRANSSSGSPRKRTPRQLARRGARLSLVELSLMRG